MSRVLHIGARALVHLKFITFNPVSEGWENPKIAPFKENLDSFCHYFTERKMEPVQMKMPKEMDEAQFDYVVDKAKDIIEAANEKARVMVQKAGTIRLRTMLGEIEFYSTEEDPEAKATCLQKLHCEAVSIVNEYRQRMPEEQLIGFCGDEDFADAMNDVFRALLAAQGGLVAEVAQWMTFNFAQLNVFLHRTILAAAADRTVSKGDALYHDKIKAFVEGLAEHADVEAIDDPLVERIILRALDGLPGRTPRGNPLDKKVTDLHRKYKKPAKTKSEAKASHSKRARAE